MACGLALELLLLGFGFVNVRVWTSKKGVAIFTTQTAPYCHISSTPPWSTALLLYLVVSRVADVIGCRLSRADNTIIIRTQGDGIGNLDRVVILVFLNINPILAYSVPDAKFVNRV